MVNFSRTAYKVGKGLISNSRYSKALVPYKALFSSVSKARTAPSAVLAKTPLKSYLDKRYAKKCGVEVKQNDGSGNPTITTSLANFNSPFVGISQGLTDSTRLGNSIEIKSYQCKINFHAGATSTAPTLVRLIIVKQLQMQLASLTGATILQDSTNIKSNYIIDKARSFTVLKDVTFTLSSFNSGSRDSYKSITYNYRPKTCHSIKWTQADATGIIGDMLEGNLQLLVMYQQPTGAASGPTCTYYDRCEWVDS